MNSPAIQIHSIHLRVSNLERSIEFYSNRLGFTVRTNNATSAALDTPGVFKEREGFAAAPSSTRLTLTEDRSAARAPTDAAGLFHAAVLLPAREALGRWLQHAATRRVKFDGFSDHGVSEAIYLSDPDGNGLEFYADRPRENWPRESGGLAMFTRPLAVADVLAAASPSDAPALSGARWGHLHLRVSSLDRSEKFYREMLGLTLMQRFGDGARFLAADGYHHHIGLNTWGGVREPQPQDALGLVETIFVIRDAAGEKAARDPDNIALQITPAR